jgi:hypothetical protein
MQARVEMAEVLSFRLKVPRSDLDRIPKLLGPELGIAIVQEDGDLLVSMEEADSFLRFKPIGSEAILTEVAICNDERALFFQKVLGALMVRYFGDLHVRLTWNEAARNADAEYAEVKIVRGATSFPGLAHPVRALPPAVSAGEAGGSGSAVPAGGEMEEPEAVLPPELREIQELLAKAKGHWDEYHRLKAKKQGS